MFLLGIGTAVPRSSYTQVECWQALAASRQFRTLQSRSQALLRKVLTNDSGIRQRHFVMSDLTEAFDISPQQQHDRFARHAPLLAHQAAEQALTEAGCQPTAMDAVLVSTCTGSLCPGLTSYLTESLGLNTEVIGLDLVGQGCGAALPNLATAAALLHAGQARRVLSVCVEVCSAAIYLDDDPGVLISACLFGDGAAAVVLGDTPPNDGFRVEWREGFSLTAPQDRELLRFDIAEGCLRNILRPEVPERAAEHAESLRRRALANASPHALAAHILHPGGRNVLRALAGRLVLKEEDLKWSAGVLHDYGNVSSPSVLFALERALKNGAPDGSWWMSSFGAGFTCHGALLEVRRTAA